MRCVMRLSVNHHALGVGACTALGGLNVLALGTAMLDGLPVPTFDSEGMQNTCKLINGCTWKYGSPMLKESNDDQLAPFTVVKREAAGGGESGCGWIGPCKHFRGSAQMSNSDAPLSLLLFNLTQGDDNSNYLHGHTFFLEESILNELGSSVTHNGKLMYRLHPKTKLNDAARKVDQYIRSNDIRATEIKVKTQSFHPNF